MSLFKSYAMLLLAAVSLQCVTAQDPTTFTWYGSGDTFGSANCATSENACGAPTQSGYTAAIDQADFGVGPGYGAGPGCNKCWTITLESDLYGNPVTSSTINVTVNNLCPISGNEQFCAVPNQYGAIHHFDVCGDTGARDALFGSTGIGAGKGVATLISDSPCE